MTRYANNITLVASETDMLYLLRNMLDNLEKTGWGAWTDEEKGGGTSQLATLIRDEVTRKPAYLDVLNPVHEPCEYGESGFFTAMEYAPRVWVLDMGFDTKCEPVKDSFEEFLNPEGLYFCRYYWGVEPGGSSHLRHCCFRDGNSGERMSIPEKYQEYGGDALAALFCSEVANITPPCNESYLKHLVNSDDGEAILKAVGEGGRAIAIVNDLDPNYAFRKHLFNAFAAILEARSGCFSPRKLDEYINALLCSGNEKALFAFIDNYDWNKKSTDAAISLLNTFAGSETAERAKDRIKDIPNIIAARKAEEFAKSYRMSDGEIELLRNTYIPAGFFKDNLEVKSVFLTGCHVEPSAFENCTNLSEIELADEWISLGDRVFAGCTSLEGVVLAFRMLSLGVEMFDGCTSLKRIEIKGKHGDASLKRKAFGSVPNLEFVSITGNVRILKGAFSGCPNIKTLKVSKKVVLGKGALDELPDGVIIKAPKGSEVAEYRDARKSGDEQGK